MIHDSNDWWPWLTIVLLGAYHGLNPAMGWLFAVSWGLQEKRRSAVLKAIGPIALGHAASVALVVVFTRGIASIITTPHVLRIGGAIALILFGLFKFFRPRSHPRWVGFRVSLFELAIWSFLMATAHGAGSMLFPILLRLPSNSTAMGDHAGASSGPLLTLMDAGVVLLHSLAMLVVLAAVALIVYEWLGVAFLRKAWLNVDLLWAVALVVAGLFTLFT